MSGPAPTLRAAAIFDLDKTLVPVNTAELFMRRQRARGEARRRDVVRTLWWLTQYSFGVVDARAIADRAALPLRGTRVDRFEDEMRAWVEADIVPLVTTAAREEVRRMRERGYEVAVLTGSTQFTALPLARALGIVHVLATELEVRGGELTGAVGAQFCFGRGKVSVAERWAREHGIALEESWFYSDSISDLPMFDRVGVPIAVNPDPRLRLLAKRRGWRREWWR